MAEDFNTMAMKNGEIPSESWHLQDKIHANCYT